MNIYSVRACKKRTKSKPHNYREITLIPTIMIGKNNEIDELKTSKEFGDQEATVYYIGFVWLTFLFLLEFWGERKKKGGLG